jgi:hypothetical protein
MKIGCTRTKHGRMQSQMDEGTFPTEKQLRFDETNDFIIELQILISMMPPSFPPNT